MKKVLQVLSGVLVLVLLLGISFGGGYLYSNHRLKNIEVVENEPLKREDLSLPKEVEKRIVTLEEVEAKLSKLSQLTTYSGNYIVNKNAEYTRYVLDNIPVPGTTNTIKLECKGVVKVGYDIEDIIPTVDNVSRVIYVAIPSPKLLSNDIDWDGIKVLEQNNILNPIEFSQYKTLVSEAKELGLEKVESEGIYEKAQENVKAIIENYLAAFDYTIKFI